MNCSSPIPILVIGLLLLACTMAEAADTRPRLLVTTDIGGDPDDQQSLVRLLVHSDLFRIQGLIASASGTPNELGYAITRTDLIHEQIDAYATIYSRLSQHGNFPSAASLRSVVKTGNPQRGAGAIGSGHDTEGSNHIISVVDASSEPTCIAIWGGQTDLAQALWKVKATRSSSAYNSFVTKIRVHDIADQDGIFDSIIRPQHPGLFYVLDSAYAGTDKRTATFRGMYIDGDNSTTSRTWLDANVRSGHGALGALYPNATWTSPNPYNGLKEGDTPSWIYFLNTGLSDANHPEWGSWGGRFEQTASNLYRDATDSYSGGSDARRTVWRWRPDAQNSFKARMDWCVKSYADANHEPLATLNGQGGIAPVFTTVSSGDTVSLSADGSSDPDGDSLSYQWFVYNEAGSYNGSPAIANSSSRNASLVAPSVTSNKTVHVILKVSDNGSPSLCSYRRLVLTVQPAGSDPDPSGAAIASGKTEAEDLDQSSFYNESSSEASGGLWARLPANGSGSLSGSFSGSAGEYDITVRYRDEYDGASSFSLRVNGSTIATWTADNASGSSSSVDTFIDETVRNVSLQSGDLIAIHATARNGEYARTDFITVSASSSQPSNTPPQITGISGHQAIISGGSASLQVSASDADGDSLSYSWAKVSGPGSVSFSGSSSATASFGAAGIYTLRATVSDGEASDNDTCTVYVRPKLSASSADKLRVMCLGDSITDGSHNNLYPGAYRIELWSQLTGAGLPTDLVGSKQNGPTSIDRDHEGSIGYRIDELYGDADGSEPNVNLTSKLTTLNPDVVLLLIGSNNALQDVATSSSVADYTTLLETIFSTKPNCTVLVGTLPLITKTTAAGNLADALNAELPGIVAAAQRDGHHAALIDVGGDLVASDLADTVHPTAGGYAKIASAWFQALEAIVDYSSSPAAPTVLSGPASGTSFAPGQTVTATGSGADLIWGIDRLMDGVGDFASGSGNSITFTVPADSTENQIIRIKLSGAGGTIERDYAIVIDDTPPTVAHPIAVGNTEAESLAMSNYSAVDFAEASGGAWAELNSFRSSGAIDGTFIGADGSYDLGIVFRDEYDGASILTLKVNGNTVDSWVADRISGSSSDVDAFETFTATGIALQQGDAIAVHCEGRNSEKGRIDLITVTPSAATALALTINFQPAQSAAPNGSLADGGAVFGDRGNGFSYGWDQTTADTRDRNADPDQHYDTLNHMQKNGDRRWEIALPNGTYTVVIVAGDPSYSDQVNSLLVEGQTIVDPDGADHFDSYELSVTVSDGRLSISPATGANNAKLCFIDISTGLSANN